MPTNNGIYKEDEMIFHLNDKKFGEVSNNLRNLLTALFGTLEEEEVIHATKTEGFIKPDFILECSKGKKYLSMKTGRAETVHQEFIRPFICFLREQGISNRTLRTILIYHYGDGTIDGSGEARIEYNRLRTLLEPEIARANEELNADKDFVWKVMERCLIIGTVEGAIPIDGIYFGDYRYGVLATTGQIKKHIYRGNWKWMKNLHIGPLQLRPHARYYGKDIKSQKRRDKIDLYWANLGSDIDYISSRYDY